MTEAPAGLAARLGPAISVGPLGLLILAAAVPAVRPVVLIVLLAGAVTGIRRRAAFRWALAAPVPVAVNLCWGLFPAPIADPFGADCTALGSPPAVWRAGEALITLTTLVVLAIALRASRSDLALRWPDRHVVQIGVIGAVLLGPVGLLFGALLARPFFGTFELDLSRPGFIVPALTFALANGVMEELAYRGALQGWTSRITGARVAVTGQAIVFGLAHGGVDVGGSPIALMLALGIGGLLAGAITLRTRSLWVPIAWHVALDLPLYVYLACRAQ